MLCSQQTECQSLCPDSFEGEGATVLSPLRQFLGKEKEDEILVTQYMELNKHAKEPSESHRSTHRKANNIPLTLLICPSTSLISLTFFKALCSIGHSFPLLSIVGPDVFIISRVVTGIRVSNEQSPIPKLGDASETRIPKPGFRNSRPGFRNCASETGGCFGN